MKNKKEYKIKLEEYAEEAIRRCKLKKKPVVCRCGETPGGTKHIGNFNDNLRSYFVYLLVKRKGYPARHIQTRDNLDPIRKLPAGFSDLKHNWVVTTKKLVKDYEKYTGKPLFNIPDVLGCCKNYSEHFRKIYEKECKKMGLTDTEYYSTYELYKKGKFNKYLKKIFKKIDIAREIDLNIEKTKPKDYVPVWAICEKCGKITGRIKNIFLEEEKVEYVCTDRNLTASYTAKGCGHNGEVDWKNGNTKMDWEFEWPAQILMFETTIEPFGKDHFNGSWPFSKQVISKVYEEELPLVFYYEHFVTNKKKMATRHGNIISLTDLMNVLEIEAIRFIYTKRPEEQRSLDFSKIINFADEFDRAEKIYYEIKKIKTLKETYKIKKNYELAMFFKIKKKYTKRISYRTAISISKNVSSSKWKDELKKRGFGNNPENIERIKLAKNWVEKYAKNIPKVGRIKRTMSSL